MSGDARTAYAFQCGNEDLFSVAHDKAGANFFAAAVRRAGYFAMNSSWARKIRCPLLSSRTRSSAPFIARRDGALSAVESVIFRGGLAIWPRVFPDTGPLRRLA
jgi:hypothetical protein